MNLNGHGGCHVNRGCCVDVDAGVWGTVSVRLPMRVYVCVTVGEGVQRRRRKALTQAAREGSWTLLSTVVCNTDFQALRSPSPTRLLATHPSHHPSRLLTVTPASAHSLCHCQSYL